MASKSVVDSVEISVNLRRGHVAFLDQVSKKMETDVSSVCQMIIDLALEENSEPTASDASPAQNGSEPQEAGVLDRPRDDIYTDIDDVLRVTGSEGKSR